MEAASIFNISIKMHELNLLNHRPVPVALHPLSPVQVSDRQLVQAARSIEGPDCVGLTNRKRDTLNMSCIISF